MRPPASDQGPLLSFGLPADPRAPGEARRRVRAVAEPLGVDVGSLDLAVSEAVTNVVVHAYRHHEAPGDVEIVVHAERDMLVVAVSDEGNGIAPRADSPGIGAGLPIIATLADALEVQQRRRGTRLVMRFALG